MASSRSLVRSFNRERNSFPARRPFGVLVKKRNCLGSLCRPPRPSLSASPSRCRPTRGRAPPLAVAGGLIPPQAASRSGR